MESELRSSAHQRLLLLVVLTAMVGLVLVVRFASEGPRSPGEVAAPPTSSGQEATKADVSKESVAPPSAVGEPPSSPATSTEAPPAPRGEEPKTAGEGASPPTSPSVTNPPEPIGNRVSEWLRSLSRPSPGSSAKADTGTTSAPSSSPATTAPPRSPSAYDEGPEPPSTRPTLEEPGTRGYDVAPSDKLGVGTDPSKTTDTTTPQVARELAYAFHVFDGFERGNGWAVESAADHAVLKLTTERATEGAQALQADFEARGKGKFELRREVKLDLAKATGFRVDVYNPGEPLDLALAFRAGTDTALFASPAQAVRTGWNRDVTFSLDDLTAEANGATLGPSWTWSRDRVSRVSLVFGERGQAAGSVVVDNLRFDRAATELGHAAKPVLKKITASAPRVERYAPLELAVEFDAEYQDFFDRAQIDVLAVFAAPSGKRLEVHGFVYDTDPVTGQPQWRVRFTPTEVGRWRYDVTVKTSGGEAPSASYELTCDRQADRRGFVRVSLSDPRYFEFDDGTFYYPLGQNVCWASKYEYFLDKIQAYGGNYVRVWLCPWNLQLEDPTEPGKYDLRVARQLDELLDQCAQRGLYLQLVLRYHDMHGESWAKNPYNSANRGPCYAPGEFFTLGAAKDLHKRFLDYVVARWGHSPALLAWELWNEADLARADREDDLVAWHREMAAYLKRADVHRHLVTTSVATPGRANGLFDLAEIDFVPVHVYARDVHAKIHEGYLRYRKLRKPVFIGEFSAGIKPAHDLEDAKGVRIHAGLWLAFTTPTAGSAMPWWWDTYVDKNDLYGHWRALAAFAQGVDRRGKDFELVRSTVRPTDDTAATLQAILAPSEAYLWLHDEGRIAPADQAERPVLTGARPVLLEGMLGGRFRVEVWDPHEGKVLQATTVTTTADGALSFDLPPCERDVAVKVVKESLAGHGGRPRLTW